MFRRLWWLIRHPQPATAAAAAGKVVAVVVLLAVMRRRGGGEGWNGWRVRRRFAGKIRQKSFPTAAAGSGGCRKLESRGRGN
ncbi:hypothetical protein Tco_0784823 [Tanacetum coccineum]